MQVTFKADMNDEEIRLAILDAVLTEFFVQRAGVKEVDGLPCTYYGFQQAAHVVSQEFGYRVTLLMLQPNIQRHLHIQKWQESNELSIREDQLREVMKMCSANWPLIGSIERASAVLEPSGLVHVNADSEHPHVQLEDYNRFVKGRADGGAAVWGGVFLLSIAIVYLFSKYMGF